MLVVAEDTIAEVEHARLLEENLTRAIDHDFGNVRVLQQWLDGAITDDLVGDVAGAPQPLVPSHRYIVQGQQVGGQSLDLGSHFTLIATSHLGGVQLAQHALVDALLHI